MSQIGGIDPPTAEESAAAKQAIVRRLEAVHQELDGISSEAVGWHWKLDAYVAISLAMSFTKKAIDEAAQQQ